MSQKQYCFITIDKSIIEFIDENLLEIEVNNVIIQRKRAEVLREIFMHGWSNYPYKFKKD